LDEVLLALKDNYASDPITPLNAEQLLSKFKVPQGRHEFFKGLIDILIEDGYVGLLVQIDDMRGVRLDIYTNHTIITPKGFYFLEQGGYTQMEIDRKESIKIKNDQILSRDNLQADLVILTGKLNFWTKVAAFVAAGLLLFYLITWIIDHWLILYCHQ
jgi:hypothetical protein